MIYSIFLGEQLKTAINSQTLFPADIKRVMQVLIDFSGVKKKDSLPKKRFFIFVEAENPFCNLNLF